MPRHRTLTSLPKGISRIDLPHTPGWLVRVYHDGETHSRFFSDGRNGGKAKSLDAAVQYRIEYQRKHPALGSPFVYMIPPPFRTKLQRNNKTGVSGVSETYGVTRSGEKLRCFSVNYALEGQRYNKRFYIDTYDSRRDALEAAREFRLEMEAQMLKEYKRRLRQLQHQHNQPAY